jgi:hypothetical protein
MRARWAVDGRAGSSRPVQSGRPPMQRPP